jgi:hypothetical protein
LRRKPFFVKRIDSPMVAYSTAGNSEAANGSIELHTAGGSASFVALKDPLAALRRSGRSPRLRPETRISIQKVKRRLPQSFCID